MRRHLTLLALTAVLLALAAPAHARADKDCKDFTSHAEAQAYFKNNGGSPSNNLDQLDGDRDGQACEGHVYRPADKPASGTPDGPANRGERLARTGPGSASSSVGAGFLMAGLLLVAATRYRPRHSR